MKNEKKIFVFLDNMNKSVFTGTLYFSEIRGAEVCAFEYADEYLAKSTVSIDPEIQLFRGRQFITNGKRVFGCFSDCCPDRWGRTLLDRKEIIMARKEKRSVRPLRESDYLLGISDETRTGAFRFKDSANTDAYIGAEKYLEVPPMASLRELQQASMSFEIQKDIYETKWFDQILKPGSSLGGARPKATVSDSDGSLWIAKFPSAKDTNNNCAWEKTVNDLAILCGLSTTEFRLERFGDNNCFLSKRFDRILLKGSIARIHFASAMTMLAKTDGESESASYLDIANFIRNHGSNPKNDLRELWKRMVFNIAVSNTDDHLRNHGFLLDDTGWRLSPLYDVTPTPFKQTLSLCIDKDSNLKSPSLALSTAAQYGIPATESPKLLLDIFSVVEKNWRTLAERNGISRSEIEQMVPAFCDDNVISEVRLIQNEQTKKLKNNSVSVTPYLTSERIREIEAESKQKPSTERDKSKAYDNKHTSIGDD